MDEATSNLPAPDEVRAQLERMTASDDFIRSPQLGAFLRFVVESVLQGKSDRIKAYTIGVDVLRRDAKFDPQLDPIVRVEATRLRRTIDRYYAGLGADDAIRIDLPRGSYIPTFSRRPAFPGVTAHSSTLDRFWSIRLLLVAIVALIVALGVGLGVGGWWLTSGRYASIPVVANDSVATATAALKQDGFTIAKVSPVHSNQVAQGTVTGTSPSGRAAKGSAVTILVSSGPFTSIVPRVQGDKLPAAEAALQRAHLTYSIERVGSTQPVGTVLGTKPGAGTSWPQTKPVAIKVAEGLPVPNFGGQSLQVAQQWAAAHGANLQQQQDQNSQQPQGTITGQEPGAGSLYQQGETVVVNVSTGPAEVSVPDVIGMSVQEATQALQAAGFRPQVQSFGLPGASNDRVWDYSPVGQAPRGSTILLDVLPGNNQGGGGGF